MCLVANAQGPACGSEHFKQQLGCYSQLRQYPPRFGQEIAGLFLETEPATAGGARAQPAVSSHAPDHAQNMEVYKGLFEQPMGDMWEDALPLSSKAVLHAYLATHTHTPCCLSCVTCK